MKHRKIEWFPVAVLLVQVAVVIAAVMFPLVITADILAGLLRVIELVAKLS